MRLGYVLWGVVLMMSLAACGGAAPSAEEPTVTTTPAPTASATFTAQEALSLDERLAAEADYERLRQLAGAIGGVWEALVQGETAQCGVTYALVSVEGISEGPLQSPLQRAASALREAVELWEAECTNPRQQVPSSVIQQGAGALDDAQLALQEVERVLNTSD